MYKYPATSMKTSLSGSVIDLRSSRLMVPLWQLGSVVSRISVDAGHILSHVPVARWGGFGWQTSELIDSGFDRRVLVSTVFSKASKITFIKCAQKQHTTQTHTHTPSDTYVTLSKFTDTVNWWNHITKSICVGNSADSGHNRPGRQGGKTDGQK